MRIFVSSCSSRSKSPADSSSRNPLDPSVSTISIHSIRSLDPGISGSQEAAEERGSRCYQVNVLRVVGGSTDVENFREEERKKEVEAIVVKREKDGESGGESGREMESVGEKTMAHGGAWLSTVAAVGINTGCRRHLRR